MVNNKVRYFVLMAAFVMLIVQLFIADYSDFFGWKNLTPFISIICLIIAMSGSIIHVNKHGEN